MRTARVHRSVYPGEEISSGEVATMDTLDSMVRKIIREELGNELDAIEDRLRDWLKGELARQRSSVVGAPFLRTQEAADYCGVAVRTLYNLKYKGGGPEWSKHGRMTMYRPGDLDTWLEARTTPGQSAASPQTRLSSPISPYTEQHL